MYVGLHGPRCLTCSEGLPERTCHFQPPEHVPRTSVGAQTCVLGPGGLPVCHGAESTRKDPRSEEQKMPKGEKNTLNFTYIYTSVCIYKPNSMISYGSDIINSSEHSPRPPEHLPTTGCWFHGLEDHSPEREHCPEHHPHCWGDGFRKPFA